MEEKQNNQTKYFFKILPFRGLDAFGTWHYGVPTVDTFCDDETAYIEEMTGSGMFPVLRGTISAAIFNRDKHKKPIYEGDIVTITAYENAKTTLANGRPIFTDLGEPTLYTGVVAYAWNACAWVVKIGKKAVLFGDLFCKKDKDGVAYFPNVEITGNIYANEAEAAE